jgi:hypothetical protein
MRRTIGMLTIAAVAASTPAWAAGGHSGSMEDQIACTPDVYRLCSQFIPDETTITACLQRNVANLSAACHKVFTRPDSPANGTDQDDDD